METRRENMNKHEAPRGGLQLSLRHLLCFSILLDGTGASLGAQLIKNPPANAGDTRDVGSVPGSGRSAGGGNANRSSVLAGKFHKPVGYIPRGHKASDMTERTGMHTKWN